jgi:oligopeptide/dipeptide ABC transporter ATP-binding protein
MDTPLLKVKNLTVKLRIDNSCYPVVKNLNFELREGSTTALVGESGCGKSMTALALLRILPDPPALPPEGAVYYRGCDLLKLSEPKMRQMRGKNIAMIFQNPLTALNPVYTIGTQLVEVAETHLVGMEGAAAKDVAIKALEDVHLPDAKKLFSLYPHQLSGGMLQRVMIAMALICSPDILIADEPTTALDVTIQAQILLLLQELQERKGMAILLISHDMGVVANCAHEVIVMYAGHQIEQGSVEQLLHQPAHPYTQALLAARPDPHRRKLRLEAIPGLVPHLNQMPDGCPFHPRCKYAMKLCRQGEVPFFSLKETDHSTECWLYDKDLKAKLTEAYEEIT